MLLPFHPFPASVKGLEFPAIVADGIASLIPTPNSGFSATQGSTVGNVLNTLLKRRSSVDPRTVRIRFRILSVSSIMRLIPISGSRPLIRPDRDSNQRCNASSPAIALLSVSLVMSRFGNVIPRLKGTKDMSVEPFVCRRGRGINDHNSFPKMYSNSADALRKS